jgi:hypothetical protein
MSQPVTVSADFQQRIQELSRQLVTVRGYL